MLPGAVIGWDMAAALQLGAALGIDPLVLAELLPGIEAVMVAKANAQIASGGPANALSPSPSRSA